MSSFDDGDDRPGSAGALVTTAADRLRWLEQVAGDPAVGPTAFRIAFGLCRHINRETGSARPSQPRLAEEARASLTAVKDALRTLTTRGHIRSVVSVGRGHASEHFPILQNRRLDDGFSDGKGAPSRRFSEDEKGSPGRRFSDVKGSNKTVAQPPPNLRQEPKAGSPSQPKGSLPGERARDAGPADGSAPPPVVRAHFSSFIDAYPTKGAAWSSGIVEDARKAFEAAVASGVDPAAIIEGAARYAKERADEITAKGPDNVRFTRKPSVWLTARDWRRRGSRQRQGGASAAPPGRGAKAASRRTVDDLIARWPPRLTEGKSREELVEMAHRVLKFQYGER